MDLAINQQINQWMLAFACKRAWTGYLDHGDIDRFLDRDLIQGILTSVDADDNKSEFETTLLILLCKINDGLDHTIRYGEDSEDITPLEGVLAQLDLIRTDWDDHLTDPEVLIVAVKRQAVYGCCREGDFEEAQFVVDRLIPDMTTKAEKELLKCMLRVIKSHDVGHEELQLHPYTELHKAVVHTMSSLIQELDTPFLVKAAKAVIETKEAGSENGRENGCEIGRENRHLESLPKTTNTGLIVDVSLSRLHKGSPRSKYLHNYKLEKLQQKRERIMANKEQYLRRMPRELQGLVNGEQRDMLNNNESPGRKRSPQKRKRCVYDPSASEEQSSESIESVESCSSKIQRTNRHDESLKSRLGVSEIPDVSRRESLAPGSSTNIVPRRFGKKLKWTTDEEEKLYRGVVEYGMGNWSEIQSKGNFHQRTNVHLKDKWRTLNQPKFRKRLCEMRDLFGTVPYVDYS